MYSSTSERSDVLVEVGIVLHSLRQALRLEQVFELLAGDVEHDVTVHLQEAPVAVIREPRATAVPGEALDGFVVQAKVEDRFHHATGIDTATTGAHGHDQRVVAIAELLS
ncbi:MAG: hypothetical protein U5K74_03180 [Gemmatimonadaceae bacterium]|nr:hypothetical protein [Gemmatimonadaceae bacterium]